MAEKKGSAVAPAPAKKGPGTAVAANPLAVAASIPGMEMSQLVEDSQRGHGFKQEDLATPFLRVLQSLSPEVNVKSDGYIEGAEVGMFVDTQAREVFDGETVGLIVIPVHHEQSFIRWKPRTAGGGLVRDYGTDASVVEQAPFDDKVNKRLFENGDELVQSNKYFIIAVHPETHQAREMVLMLAGMQRKKAKKWNTKIASIQVPRPGGAPGTFNPAMFYVAYEIKTVYEENDKGNWYGITEPKPITATVNLPNGAELYVRARDFAGLIEAGKVKVQAPAQEVEYEEVAADPDDNV